MVSTYTMATFAAVVKDFVVSTHEDLYFLSQDPYEVLAILIDNEFNAYLSWCEMVDGTGEDHRWNRWRCSNKLHRAREMMELMVQKVGFNNLCTLDGINIIRTRLSEINFSSINYNFLSDDENDSDSERDVYEYSYDDG